ncbi:MAG: serine hydrolase, partial [Frankiaceae bacterium]|nr:serine hydrolase [Frankiaceae bacterium]
WVTYTGLTTSQISAKLGSTYRLVDVHEDPGGGTYTVTAVKNSGSYATAWWWYVNASTAQVSTFLSNNNARLISVEQNAAGNYNVIMVANTGSAARAWWWYVGQSTATISSELSANNARLVSVQPDKTDSGYSVIMVSNTGTDAKGWWWYVHQSVSQISSLLNTNGGRITDLSRNSDGTYNVVMVQQAGTDNIGWKWYVGAGANSLVSGALQTGYRIFDIEPYTNGASTSYAAVEIDNLPAENRRVENIFESGYSQAGLSGGRYGYLVKPIGNASVLSLQNTNTYEPASGIKALYNLYSQFQVQIGDDDLNSNFDYWVKPSDPTNKDVCPLDYSNTNSNKVTTTLADGLGRMMFNSDNRTTQGVDLRYGRAKVNNFAQIIGMAGTKIKQTVGCGIVNGGFVTTTLNNLQKLYEGVFTDKLLDASDADLFFNRMNGGTGTISSSSPFGQMVTQEANKLGKSGAVSGFLAAIQQRDKGGSYDMCFTTGACDPPYDYVRSDAGIMQLPFKTAGGSVVLHNYAYGFYVNDLSIPCAFNTTCAAKTQADDTTNQFLPEIFRHQVDLALANW